MAENQFINKVVYGNQTLIDLTQDSVSASTLLEGETAHNKTGAIITGTMPTLAHATEDANASANEILATRTAYVNGVKITGSMPNVGSQESTISTKEQSVSIQTGYHDGSGSVRINEVEKAKLIASNIREGVEILGVLGTMSGSEDVKATPVNVTPYTTSQTIVPGDIPHAGETGYYNYISQVNVSAIAYTEVDNVQGGKTVTIGTIAPV